MFVILSFLLLNFWQLAFSNSLQCPRKNITLPTDGEEYRVRKDRNDFLNDIFLS